MSPSPSGATSTSTSPKSDEAAPGPPPDSSGLRPDWRQRRRLVRLAKSAVSGDTTALSAVWGDHEARDAVAERFQLLLLLFFCASVVFFFLSANLLASERTGRNVAANFVRVAYPRECGPSGRAPDPEECLRRARLAEGRYTVAVGLAFLLCLLTAPLNGIALVLVCRRHYARNIWFCWLAVHYLVLFFFVVSLFLLPMALGLYWVIRVT